MFIWQTCKRLLRFIVVVYILDGSLFKKTTFFISCSALHPAQLNEFEARNITSPILFNNTEHVDIAEERKLKLFKLYKKAKKLGPKQKKTLKFITKKLPEIYQTFSHYAQPYPYQPSPPVKYKQKKKRGGFGGGKGGKGGGNGGDGIPCIPIHYLQYFQQQQQQHQHQGNTFSLNNYAYQHKANSDYDDDEYVNDDYDDDDEDYSVVGPYGQGGHPQYAQYPLPIPAYPIFHPLKRSSVEDRNKTSIIGDTDWKRDINGSGDGIRWTPIVEDAQENNSSEGKERLSGTNKWTTPLEGNLKEMEGFGINLNNHNSRYTNGNIEENARSSFNYKSHLNTPQKSLRGEYFSNGITPSDELIPSIAHNGDHRNAVVHKRRSNVYTEIPFSGSNRSYYTLNGKRYRSSSGRKRRRRFWRVAPPPPAPSVPEVIHKIVKVASIPPKIYGVIKFAEAAKNQGFPFGTPTKTTPKEMVENTRKPQVDGKWVFVKTPTEAVTRPTWSYDRNKRPNTPNKPPVYDNTYYPVLESNYRDLNKNIRAPQVFLEQQEPERIQFAQLSYNSTRHYYSSKYQSTEAPRDVYYSVSTPTVFGVSKEGLRIRQAQLFRPQGGNAQQTIGFNKNYVNYLNNKSLLARNVTIPLVNYGNNAGKNNLRNSTREEGAHLAYGGQESANFGIYRPESNAQNNFGEGAPNYGDGSLNYGDDSPNFGDVIVPKVIYPPTNSNNEERWRVLPKYSEKFTFSENGSLESVKKNETRGVYEVNEDVMENRRILKL